MIKPVFTLRDIEPQSVSSSSSSCKWWTAIQPSTVGGNVRFYMGLVVSSMGTTCALYPDVSVDESRARMCMIISGKALVKTGDGVIEELHQYDTVYGPPGKKCQLKNIGTDDLYYLWLMSPSNHAEDIAGNQVRIVHTLSEVAGNETTDPGNTNTDWLPLAPETTGSRVFNLGLIARRPGTASPMHGHDPPDMEEAFMVFRGSLKVVDESGTSFTLGQYDCMYIPPYGRHLNMNAGSSDLIYSFAEAPARTRDEMTKGEVSWIKNT